jgi:hypothetical protein
MANHTQHTNRSALIRLNSTDLSPFTATTNDGLYSMSDQQLHNVKYVVLKSVRIPNTQYNVNSNNNAWLFPNATKPAGDYLVPEGQYDISTLMTTLETLVGGGLTITQDAVTQKLAFDMGGPLFSLIGDASTNVFGYNILGTRSTVIDSAVSVTASSLPNLAGLRGVQIRSKTLAPFAHLSGSDGRLRRVFATVPITVDFGQTQTHEETDIDNLDFSDFASDHGRNLSQVDITLLDSDTNLPLILNGGQYEIILRTFS